MFPDDDGNGVDERKGIGGGDKPFDPMDYLEVEVEAGDEVGEDSQEEGPAGLATNSIFFMFPFSKKSWKANQ